jgi:hypothetical protein
MAAVMMTAVMLLLLRPVMWVKQPTKRSLLHAQAQGKEQAQAQQRERMQALRAVARVIETAEAQSLWANVSAAGTAGMHHLYSVTMVTPSDP